MIKVATLTGMLAFAFTGQAQNLVPNGGMDVYSAVPTAYAQVCRADGWSSPSGYCSMVVGCGSPDYYNTAGSGGAGAPATFWATVAPHSGSGFIGFAPWYVGSPTFREYVRTALSTPMIPDYTYTVSFWLTNGNSTLHPYGITRLGVAFSTAPLTQSCGAVINVVPQIEIPTLAYSTTWQHYTFSFTADQPYQYLCIGNFVPFASTVAVKVGILGNSGAYYYIDDVSVVSQIPLPIELLRFDAALESHRSVKCTWATASEIDNDRFVVERSTDGITFEGLGTVPGSGTTAAEHAYSFVDPVPKAGIDLYRLKQIDMDGSFTYSETRSVQVGVAEAGLLAWAGDEGVIIELSTAIAHAVNIDVSDMNGRLVTRQRLDPGQRTSVRAAAGCYLVRGVDEPLIASRKVMVPE